MNGTLRLIIPDWQAGNRTEFFLGTEILSMLAPENQNQKTVKVDI